MRPTTEILQAMRMVQSGMLDYQRARYERLQAAGVTADIRALVVHEMVGGPCPHCNAPWVKVKVENILADYEYFDPGCTCYQRCRRCGMSLHGIVPPGKHSPTARCPRCGYAGDWWRLLCMSCGQAATTRTRYERWICEDCNRGGKKKRKATYQEA